MNDNMLISRTNTLVDVVEDKLLNYFKENNIIVGDPIPSENELAESLSVARTVIREALSRLKMIGLIECRTRRGMILTEPSMLVGFKRIIDPRILSKKSILDLLGFRISLEVGMTRDIFRNIKPSDLVELENIVKVSCMFDNNEYSPFSEYSFHSKLYSITGNNLILEFQNMIHPIMEYVKDKFKESIEPINIEIKKKGALVTHIDLLKFLQQNDEAGFRNALEQHFEVYRILINEANNVK